jgi:hypothetical protein
MRFLVRIQHHAKVFQKASRATTAGRLDRRTNDGKQQMGMA